MVEHNSQINDTDFTFSHDIEGCEAASVGVVEQDSCENDSQLIPYCLMQNYQADFAYDNTQKDSYITDTDFIPFYIKEGDDADLIYGILQHYHYCINGKVEYIYNLVCSLCEKQKALILKRIRAKRWIKLLEGIIDRLGYFQNKKENEVYYYLEVPFCEIFYGHTGVILQAYEFAHSMLCELLETDFKDIGLIELENDAYPVKSLKELFLTFKEDVENGLLAMTNMSTFTGEMVFDEMIKRNLILPYDKLPKDYDNDIEVENRYMKHLLGGKVKLPFITKEVVYSENCREVSVDVTALKFTGALYYMLIDEVKDTNTIAKVASYVLGYDWSEKKNERPAAYYYVHSPSKFTKKGDVEDYIVENLKKYNFAVPKSLQKNKKE